MNDVTIIPAPPAEILRGWEVVRLNRMTRSWDSVSNWRPTELALRQAAQDLKWMIERNPHEQYELRAIVSVRREAKVEPLVFTEDEVTA